MAPAPPPGAPPALAAFLRGVGRRALLFAGLQAGDGAAVDAALSRAVAGFAAVGAGLPMGAWPARFWAALLAALPKPGASGGPSAQGMAPLAVQAALGAPGSGARVAMLLALVAGLDEDDGGAALGVDAATWRLALRRAAPRDARGEFDEAAWRALAAAVRDALRELPDARLAWWEQRVTAALASRPADAPIPRGTNAGAAAGGAGAADRDVVRRRRAVRVLWAAVAACALGFVATFLPWRDWSGSGGNANPSPSQALPLADAGAPAATYDATYALQHHPDLPRLLAGEDAVLRELDFGAWYAARRAAEAAAPAAVPAANERPAIDATPGAAAPAAVALPSFELQSPAQRAEFARRAAADDALSRDERGLLRERWDAWLHLPRRERDALHAALAAAAALPAEERQALRDAFDAQPGDLQRGWLLGPVLGAHWPRLEPLLQQVPANEREPLLARLHAMDEAALEALGDAALRTPPQSRPALRQRLLRGADPAADDAG